MATFSGALKRFRVFFGHGKTSARDCSLFERLVLPIPTEAKHHHESLFHCLVPPDRLKTVSFFVSFVVSIVRSARVGKGASIFGWLK